MRIGVALLVACTALSATACKKKSQCGMLEEQYAKALSSALACTPGKDQCTVQVDSSLGCRCSVFANAANAEHLARLKALRSEFDAAGCTEDQCRCMMPKSGSCEPSPSGEGGVCQSK